MNQRFSILTLSLMLTTLLAQGCFTASAGAIRPTGVQAVGKCSTPEDEDRMADQVLELINLERAQRDLQPVMLDAKLTTMAKDFACRMVRGKFFSHRDPKTGYGPADRAIVARYPFFAIGENLAAGQESAAEVMKLWMQSESHRDIILDPTWRDVGIAVRAGGEHGLYWVQEFGDPANF